jgi:ketosteroid isomerase-like protein
VTLWREAMNNRPHQNTAGDPQELAQLLVAWANAGDIEGMVALYHSDTVACGNGRIAVGKEAIRRFYTERLATGIKFNIVTQSPALICGDLALTSAHLPNGNVTAEIARKQSDGTWLWVIDQPSIG